jgi:hypothetical protein
VYNVEGGTTGAGGLTVNGGFNGLPGPAWQVLGFLEEQSILKVAEITTGKFEPFSKDFRASNSVSNTIDWPPLRLPGARRQKLHPEPVARGAAR